MPAYDLTPFTARDRDGFTRVWCRLTWTPRGGDATRSAVGDYLDTHCGSPVMCCGMEEAADAIGFADLDDDYMVMVAELIDRQLAMSPKAELHCPEGHLTVTLTEPPRG